jgi:hypothetical protein
LQVFHGASRTRTGDLLGAISALAEPGFGFVEGFPATRHRSPNTFPNISAPVLHGEGTIRLKVGLGTREVAGSRPPGPGTP